MFIRCVILAATIAFTVTSWAGAVRYEKEETVVKEATHVFVAEISAYKTSSSDCGHNQHLTLTPVEWLKGQGDVTKHYEYSTWRPKMGPDCPSVHYVAPPQAPELKKGAKVIAVMGGSRYAQPDRVYGTFDPKRLKEIRGWLAKKTPTKGK